MILSASARLGRYEILSPLGAGGMGEVYRARDTRLERTVAVKVLPTNMASSPEVRQRFEREARTISQLSHPHICALYDVGREGETEYLVMELLEGETLSDRLARGALPLEQTLRFGIEIADALDKAHRQGIVHRDLKPGNVMLTKSGVKLLDFGLAKAMAPVTPPGSLTALPTRQGFTQEGTILGTFQYMAPEQLEGKEADGRTDIFAFGAVLYEMATGRKAFSGASQASLISAIMQNDPAPISSIQPMSPPALDRIVKKCLAKDPEDRWQNAADLGSELKWIGESGSQVGAPAVVVARRKISQGLSWGSAVLLFAVALFFAVGYFRRSPVAERDVRASILAPEKATFRFFGSSAGPPALSPDGRLLAFVATTSDGTDLIWIRPLNALSAQPLAGTEGATHPFWSADSRFIGFFADGKLKKIDPSGGPAQTLCDAAQGRGGTWNREGTILFAPTANDAIYRISSSGGTATRLTRFDPSRHEESHRWPYFLPDGRHFLFFVRTTRRGNGIYLGSLESGEEKFIVPASSNMAYAPSFAGSPEGLLLFEREGNLMAQPFEAPGFRTTGEPFPIAEKVARYEPTNSAIFSVSQTGVLAYWTGTAGAGQQLSWFDRVGKSLGSVGAPGTYNLPRISPDGTRVAFSLFDPRTASADIWIEEIPRGVRTRFTFAPRGSSSPVWSSDGARIAFLSGPKGANDLYQKPATGSGGEEILLESNEDKSPTDWSTDGRFIAFQNLAAKSNTKLDLWILSVSDHKARPFLQTPFNEGWGCFSPDGRWLAYVSDESGRYQVYVQPFPGPGGKWQISTAGGSQPVWRRDGKELFFIAPDYKLMAVEVVTGGTAFAAGTPRALFQTRAATLVVRAYDVSPDGQRFLINSLIGDPTSSPITLVLNWTAGLRM